MPMVPAPGLVSQGACPLTAGTWLNTADSAADPFTTAVKTTVRRLRLKVGDPPVIQTVREGGYRIGDG